LALFTFLAATASTALAAGTLASLYICFTSVHIIILLVTILTTIYTTASEVKADDGECSLTDLWQDNESLHSFPSDALE
jgi:hypothetical protein